MQIPHQLKNSGSLPDGYVTFAADDPDNGCVLPNGHYRVRTQIALRRVGHSPLSNYSATVTAAADVF